MRYIGMLTEINYKGDIIMEQMGIVRRLDALGRVVIPREFRKLNRIEVATLSRYAPSPTVIFSCVRLICRRS